MLETIQNTVQETLNESIAAIAEFLPKILLGLVVLLIGWLIAKALRAVITKLVNMEIFRKITSNEMIDKLKLSQVAKNVLPYGVYWIIIFTAIKSASAIAGLTVITDTFNSLIAFLPVVVTGVVIMLLTFTVANFVAEMVKKVIPGNPKALLLSNVASYAVIGLGFLIASDAVGLDLSVLTNNISIILAGVMLAVGISAGLGGKDLMKRKLEQFIK